MQGPLPAQVTRWKPSPPTAPRPAKAPGEAKTVYVVPKVDFDRKGAWLGIAMLKGPHGLEASRVPSPTVGQYPRIPRVGQNARRTSTP